MNNIKILKVEYIPHYLSSLVKVNYILKGEQRCSTWLVADAPEKIRQIVKVLNSNKQYVKTF